MSKFREFSTGIGQTQLECAFDSFGARAVNLGQITQTQLDSSTDVLARAAGNVGQQETLTRRLIEKWLPARGTPVIVTVGPYRGRRGIFVRKQDEVFAVALPGSEEGGILVAAELMRACDASEEGPMYCERCESAACLCGEGCRNQACNPTEQLNKEHTTDHVVPRVFRPSQQAELAATWTDDVAMLLSGHEYSPPAVALGAGQVALLYHDTRTIPGREHEPAFAEKHLMVLTPIAEALMPRLPPPRGLVRAGEIDDDGQFGVEEQVALTLNAFNARAWCARRRQTKGSMLVINVPSSSTSGRARTTRPSL